MYFSSEMVIAFGLDLELLQHERRDDVFCSPVPSLLELPDSTTIKCVAVHKDDQ